MVVETCKQDVEQDVVIAKIKLKYKLAIELMIEEDEDRVVETLVYTLCNHDPKLSVQVLSEIEKLNIIKINHKKLLEKLKENCRMLYLYYIYFL